MRDTIENISLLQKQLNDLQLENQVLKNILDQSGISYMQALKRLRTPETVTAYDPDQGARIIGILRIDRSVERGIGKVSAH